MISIIIPIYKVEKYLKKCVDSILSQSLDEIEVILVDDGSPDNCPLICDEYAKTDSRAVVLHKQNEGTQKAVFDGIKIAKGEFIAFVDGDDFLSSDALLNLHKSIVENNADISVGGFTKVFEDSDKRIPFLPREKTYNKSFDIANLVELFSVELPFIGPTRWAKLFKKNLILRILPYCDETIIVGEDANLVYGAFAFADKIAVFDKSVYCYLIRQSSVSFVRTSYWENSYKKLIERIDVLSELFPESDCTHANFIFNYALISELCYAYNGKNKTLLNEILND